MSLERTDGQRDSIHVGLYLATFDGTGAYIEHGSTHAYYRVQAATATNAVDFMKHYKCPFFVGPHCVLVYSSNASSGKGGGRRGTGEDWIMEVVVEPYKRKLSSSRSS